MGGAHCKLNVRCLMSHSNPWEFYMYLWSPLNPMPATCHKRKQKLHCNFRKVALQKLHCNNRFSQWGSNLPIAALQQEKLQCNIEKAALRESGAFLSLCCRFQAPTSRLPRLGPTEGLEHNQCRSPKQLGSHTPIFGNPSCKKSGSGFKLVF